MPVPSPVLAPDEQDPLKKIRSRVQQQMQSSLSPDGPMAPFTPAPPPRVPPRAPILPPPPKAPIIPGPINNAATPPTQRTNYVDMPGEPGEGDPNFPSPGPDPNLPPPPPSGDPLSGIPDDLINALYGDRKTITNPELAAQYLQRFVGPWKAKDWKGLFEAFTKDLNPNMLLDPSSDTRRVLERLGFKISPPNAAGETTKIQTPDGHWIRVLGGAKGQYTYTWVDQGDGGGGGEAPDIGNYNQKIRELILTRLGQLKFDPDSPLIQQTMQVNERDQEAIRAQRRAAAAERMAQEGLNSGGQGSGALDAEIASGYEDKGTALSRIRTSLVNEQYQQMRQEYTQLLQLATQAGDSEAARQLQAWWYGIQMAFEQNRQNQQPFE